MTVYDIIIDRSCRIVIALIVWHMRMVRYVVGIKFILTSENFEEFKMKYDVWLGESDAKIERRVSKACQIIVGYDVL